MPDVNKKLTIFTKYFAFLIKKKIIPVIKNIIQAAQMQRESYKDHTGKQHPVDYFKTSEYMYQCPPDPTRYKKMIVSNVYNTAICFSRYFKCPQYYTKYKDPPVLPITLNRSYRSPSLPARALTGRYNPQSDIAYKR